MQITILITILRHGTPNLPDWEKIHSSRMPEWINAYNSSGVMNETNPPYQKMANELEHKFIVCSDLARSIHSAEIIGYQSPDLVDKIFREAELPQIKIPIIRLTPHVWSMIFRVLWFAGFSTNAEPITLFKSRISLAAETLIQNAKNHDSILFIGHGIFNRFLAKELISKGWSGDEAPNGKNTGVINIGNVQHTQKSSYKIKELVRICTL